MLGLYVVRFGFGDLVISNYSSVASLRTSYRSVWCLQPYRFTVQHHAGILNGNADALSRSSVN